MKIVLGLNAFHADTSACLIRNNEMRFNVVTQSLKLLEKNIQLIFQ